MNEREFDELIETTFLQVEDALEEMDEDLDLDSSGGLLTVGFENGSTIILSRQSGNLELWVAARSGGFHLGYHDSNWVCDRTGETLQDLLTRVCSEQLGKTICLQFSG